MKKGGINMECNKLLSMVTAIGSKMLEYGAEIYRVEESIVRIAKTYGAKEINVWAIPSSIIVTLDMGNDDISTITKRTYSKEIDLYKVDRLNSLSRYICNEKPSFEEVQQIMTEIINAKQYPRILIFICFAFIAGAFCLFFGGNIYDAIISSCIGILIKVLLDFFSKFKTNRVFANIICSGVSTAIAIISVKLGLGSNYDKIIIGTIMLLVPGLVLTNAMRDFIMGDLMAGILRMIETFLVATGIAIGVVLVLSLFNFSSIV